MAISGNEQEKIRPADRVPVTITPRQRDLITEHTFAEPDSTEPLRRAVAKGRKLVVKFHAQRSRGASPPRPNHAEDKKLERELDGVSRASRLLSAPSAVRTANGIKAPAITQLIVDVLEGTKPAFDLRDSEV